MGLCYNNCVHLCSPLERAEKPFLWISWHLWLITQRSLSFVLPFPYMCRAQNRPINSHTSTLHEWEGEAEKGCAVLSVLISTSTCHLWVCHLKAFLLNEIKSVFNKIKDKKKYMEYEVKRHCKKTPENPRKLCLSNECLDAKHYLLLCILENFVF